MTSPQPGMIGRLRSSEGFSQLVAVVALFAVWWAVARFGGINPFLLPPVESVMGRLMVQLADGSLATNVSQTLARAFAGYATAAIVGIPLGLVIARTRLGRWFFSPIVAVGFPAPKLAFLPIFLLWFGVGPAAQIMMIALSCAFIIISATSEGASVVEQRLLWSARNLGTSKAGILWRIVLPSALPQIISGLQIALPVSLLTAIATEMYMGGRGLGGAILTAGRFADAPGVYAGICVAAVIGIVLVRLAQYSRGLLLVWHTEKSGEDE